MYHAAVSYLSAYVDVWLLRTINGLQRFTDQDSVDFREAAEHEIVFRTHLCTPEGCL